jgi:RNA polymerase sigma factor (sigma-70 family)
MSDTPEHGSSLETRPSLLNRLKTGDDEASWQEFYRTYGGLIRFFAEKAGLTPDEAEEVVQETAIGVARRLPEFVYDPKVCRFKTWLLNLTRWRIQDQLRRRKALGRFNTPGVSGGSGQGSLECDSIDQTATVERIADPTVLEFGAEWDAAWEKNLLSRAVESVRLRIDERQFQVFDFSVTKGWTPAEVAQTLGISRAQVYLTKHRVLAQVKKEIRRLEKIIQAYSARHPIIDSLDEKRISCI